MFLEAIFQFRLLSARLDVQGLAASADTFEVVARDGGYVALHGFWVVAGGEKIKQN